MDRRGDQHLAGGQDTARADLTTPQHTPTIMKGMPAGAWDPAYSRAPTLPTNRKP